LRAYEVALILSRQSTPILTNTCQSPPTSIVYPYTDSDYELCGQHPNYKPYAVLEPLIRYYTNVNDTICDLFSGSGSISVSALKLGRSVICVEQNQQWYNITKKRLENINKQSNNI
jgi:DNA modification methylase